jgi:hypothetical protein
MPVLFSGAAKAGLRIGLIFGGLGLLAGMIVPLVTVPGPMKFIGLAVGAFTILLWSKVFKGVLKPLMDQDKILKTGEQTSATLLKIWETGTYINNKPYLGMLLEVTLSGEVYQVETKAVVSMLEIIHYQPGAKLIVRVDPMNKQNVVVEGLASIPATSPQPLSSKIWTS